MIHVAGTKGKGSTCALTESILRNCGYSTGFTSSPHLMEVSCKPYCSVSVIGGLNHYCDVSLCDRRQSWKSEILQSEICSDVFTLLHHFTN